MAIIYSYPNKVNPKLTDLLLITDKEAQDPINQTKTITIQQIADLVDDEVTLQEVLNASDIGNTPPTASATGNIVLSGNITLTNLGVNGTSDFVGLATFATVDINGGNIDATIIGASTPAAGNFSTVDINGGNIDNTVIGAAVPAASTFTSMTASTVNIDGGTIDSTLIGSSFASEAKFATQGTNSAVQVVGNFTGAAALRVFQGPIQFGNTGGVGYGNVGDVIKSNGSAGTPEWIPASELSVENLIEVVENNTGSLIAKGTPIYIAANPSGTPRVEPADAALAGTMPASGLAYEDIPAGAGQEGQMIIAGQLEGVNLSGPGFIPSVGDVAYVASGGGYGERPTGVGRLVQNIAIVTKSGGNGTFQVMAIGRTNDLPNNDSHALFSANGSGAPVSTTGVFEVNVGSGLTTITDSFKINAASPAGSNNTIIGNEASDLLYNTGGTANANVVLGKNSMSGGGAVGDNSSFNVAIGNQALAGNNNAVVTDPLRNTTIQNIAIGHQALSQPGGGAPTAPAGAHVRSGNIAIGYQNMPSLYGLAGTEGTNNTSIGNSAGFNMETGLENTFVGANSGNNVTTGTGNTLVGYGARTRNATDEYSVALGHDAEANSLGIALGTLSRAGAGEFNINVSGAIATPRGGLLSVPAAAGPFPPAGVSPGDVYVIQDVDMLNLGGPAGQLVNIMAIA